MLRLALERAQDDLVELGGNLGHDTAGRRRAVREHRVHGLRPIVTAEEALPGERLPEHDARRVDVALRGRWRGEERQLRREVGELSEDRLVLGRRRDARTGSYARDPEVRDARDPVHVDEHVVRGDVAMDDLEGRTIWPGRPVGSVETVEDAREDRRRDAWRNARLLFAQDGEDAIEGDAADVLHDDEQIVLRRDDVEGLDDVRMVQEAGEARLLQQQLDDLGVTHELGPEPLDGDRLGEAAGASNAPEVHPRHPAGSELRQQLVLIESFRHGRDTPTRSTYHCRGPFISA
ncbi:MAG: hypothetical protein U0270_39340 [Labilithrix sp.]